MSKIPGQTGRLVVAFDIPEVRRTDRQKFRRQLRRWNFELIQQSVWQAKEYPSDFDRVVEELGLTECVKVYDSKELFSIPLMKRPLHKRDGLVKSRD